MYLDFQTAFDSVPHQRLLTKLKGYGIQGKLLNWVENILKNSKQSVQVDGSSSVNGQTLPAVYLRVVC